MKIIHRKPRMRDHISEQVPFVNSRFALFYPVQYRQKPVEFIRCRRFVKTCSE